MSHFSNESIEERRREWLKERGFLWTDVMIDAETGDEFVMKITEKGKKGVDFRVFIIKTYLPNNLSREFVPDLKDDNYHE